MTATRTIIATQEISGILYALSNDGLLFQFDPTKGPKENPWTKMPKLPQDEYSIGNATIGSTLQVK